MNKLIWVILALFLSRSIAGGETQKRNLTVDDVLAIQDVHDPQVSPDGKWIAFVVDVYDKKADDWNSDIFMVPFGGGEPIRLSASEKDDTSPRWSPDNKWLAFKSKRGKKEQVYLLNRNGGDAIQLTDVKQGVEDFSWSPDSKKLALVIKDPDPDANYDEDTKDKTEKPIVITRLQFLYDEYGFLKELYKHIYTIDLETKAIKQITSGPNDDAGPVWSSYLSTPQWSPDGKQILFVSNRTKNPDSNRNLDLFVVPADGGVPKQLTTNPGTDENPFWSPDGKYIAYQTVVKPEMLWYEMNQAAMIPATGGDPKFLTKELDRNTWQYTFSADSKRIYFILEDHGTQTLASISTAGTDLNKDLTGEKAVADYSIGPEGIALLTGHHDLPNEVFTFESGKTRQASKINAAALAPIQLGKVERVEFNSKDGTGVEGFVTKPPDFNASKKYPLILWIHGGPTSQYFEEFGFQSQLFAANGYVVLRVNPRGSTGYGETFCKAIFADWGNVDYEDVMAGVDHLIKLGYVDENRMGVGGWSYGGMLTDHVITKTQRFQAAISGASELNYLMDYGVDHYQNEWEIELGLPWEKPEAYTKISPFFKIKNVTTPTLVLCGKDDVNVPLVNSEQLYQALKRLGVDTMLIVYPGEPHTFYTPSYHQDRYERYLAWYGHYLKGEADKVPKRAVEKQ